jgi:solute carrier family 35 protein
MVATDGAVAAAGGASAAPAPPPTPPERDTPLAVSVFAALFFGATSIALVFVNKWGITLFPLTNAILLLQLAMTLALFAAKRATEPSSAFAAWDAATARNAAPLAAVYLGNIVFSLMSLKGLNLPMYLVLRRNTPLACMLLKKIVFGGGWPSPQVAVSVLVVCGGSIIAGYANLDFDLKSYAMAIGSCFLQATYMLLVELKTRPPAVAQVAAPALAAEGGGAADKDGTCVEAGGVSSAQTPPAQPAHWAHSNTHPLSEGEMLHYNSLLSLPVIFLISLLTGELAQAPSAAAAAVAKTSAFTLAVALGGCAGGGLLLNYATMLCTSTNSALTTTVVGVLKGVVGTLGGFFAPLGGGARFTTAGLVGVAMNTAGGVAYSYAKFEEKRAKKAQGLASKASGVALAGAGGEGGWGSAVRADGGGAGGAGGGGAHARKPLSRGSGEAAPLLG